MSVVEPDGSVLSVRECLARSYVLSERGQEDLARDEDAEVRYALAKNVGTLPGAQLRLARDAGQTVRCALASSAAVALEAQLVLARDDSANVRSALAQNPAATVQAQEVLVRDEISYVRQDLAGNTGCAPSTQLALREDPEGYVRSALAKNPAATAQVQRLLSKGDHYDRSGLAWNAALLPELVHSLAADADGYVRLMLAKNQSVVLDAAFPLSFLKLSEAGKALVAASTRTIDPEVLTALEASWAGTLEELLETIKEFTSA